MPSVKTIQLFLPYDSIQYYRDTVFKDPITGIELDLKTVFN
jgi:hypothetical protein